MKAFILTTVAALSCMAPLAVQGASSASCTTLTQNVLTSSGCPAECGSNPCVFYSPSQAECPTYQTSYPCLHDDSFTISNTQCNVTYQCMDALVNASIPGVKKWYLALSQSKQSDTTVMTAPVTEIKQLKYPTNVSVVQLAGGLGRNVRGDVKNVILDASFFATPSSVVSFYVSELNLPTFLSKIDFAKVGWTSIAFNNANLDAVPAGFSSLSLNYIELNKNVIKSINDSTPFLKAKTLMLQENDLTDFPIDLPAVEYLDLSGNPLTTIPESIFRMTKLQKLLMRDCNFTNLQLTDAQFAFLEQRQFDGNAVTTTCGSGYTSKTLTSGGVVCIPGGTVETKASSNTTPVVVGVVAGAVVIAIVAIVFLRRRCRRPNVDSEGYVSGDKRISTTIDIDSIQGSGPGSDPIWNDPALLAVRVEHRDIEPIKLLARGGFGEVWLGLYMNENVAIKRLLNDKKNMNDALAFASEIKIMARLEHPKIVRFIGVSWTNALTIQAVTEFMDCGDLRSLLDSPRASSLTWANLKCQIAIDVADALVYLHTLSPKLIHRDLKSRNVLIDANTGAKLSDFGISRNRTVEETMTAGVGTARWIAPEVILGGHYTEFADIYSFGVVLSELDTSKTPFHDATNTNGAKMQDVTILQLVSAGKLQPSFNTSCPGAIVKLARACMSFDPEQRPSAIHISYELRKILKGLVSEAA